MTTALKSGRDTFLSAVDDCIPVQLPTRSQRSTILLSANIGVLTEEQLMPEKKWKTYEEVAAYLLNQFATHFELGEVEGKQLVPGESGTEWEIDAKGLTGDHEHFVIVECKRHTRSGIDQATTASLAWRIQDTGASGGILVSPIGLQEGAKKVAQKAGIYEVILDQNSTTTDYVLKFLNHVCVGLSDTFSMHITDHLTITVRDKDGNIVETSSD